MELKDLANIGKKIAKAGLPLLGTALGGPLGMKAGLLISSLIGKTPEDMTPEDFDGILANPEMMVKLKEIELNHEVELQKIILEAERMRLADIADARNREIETTKATGKRDFNLYAVAWLYILGFFACLILLIVMLWAGKFPEKIPASATMLIGSLFTALVSGVGAVLQYFFGSSKGSSDKNKVIAAAMTTAPQMK